MCVSGGSETPHNSMVFVRDSRKVNVFCALSKDKVYGPVFFIEPTVTCMT
jgi:hypothetical protein